MKKYISWTLIISIIVSLFVNYPVEPSYASESNKTKEELQALNFDSMLPDELIRQYESGEITDAMIRDYFVLVKEKDLYKEFEGRRIKLNSKTYAYYKNLCYGDPEDVQTFMNIGFIDGTIPQDESTEVINGVERSEWRYLGMSEFGHAVSNDEFRNDFGDVSSDPRSRDYATSNQATQSWEHVRSEMTDFQESRIKYESLLNDDQYDGVYEQQNYSMFSLLGHLFSNKNSFAKGFKNYFEIMTLPTSDQEMQGRLWHKNSSGGLRYDSVKLKTAPYVIGSTQLSAPSNIYLTGSENVKSVDVSFTTNMDFSNYSDEIKNDAGVKNGFFISSVYQQIDGHVNEQAFLNKNIDTPDTEIANSLNNTFTIDLNVSDVPVGGYRDFTIKGKSFITSRDNTSNVSDTTKKIRVYRPSDYFVDMTIRHNTSDGIHDVTDGMVQLDNLTFAVPETFTLKPNVIFKGSSPVAYQWKIFRSGNTSEGYYYLSNEEEPSLTITSANKHLVYDNQLKFILKVKDGTGTWHESQPRFVLLKDKVVEPSTDPVAVLKSIDEDRMSSYRELEVQVGERVRHDGRESYIVEGGKPIKAYSFDTDAVMHKNKSERGYIDVYYASIHDDETVELTVYDEDNKHSSAEVDIEVVEPIVRMHHEFSGALKENRKSTVTMVYDEKPRFFNPISTSHEIISPNGGTYYVDLNINNKETFDIQFEGTGTYQIKTTQVFAVDNRPSGYTQTYVTRSSVNIVPDKAPEGTGTAPELIIRQPDDGNRPTLRIYMDAVSTDGDLIESIDIYGRIDSDNDNNLGDHGFTKIATAHVDNVYYDWKLPSNYVGSGEYYTIIKEKYNQPVLRWLSQFNRSLRTQTRSFTVDNVAPGFAFDMDNKKKVDILIATDLEGTYRANLETELNKTEIELLQNNVDVNFIVVDDKFVENSYEEYKYQYIRYLTYKIYDSDRVSRYWSNEDDDTAHVSSSDGKDRSFKTPWESIAKWESEAHTLPDRLDSRISKEDYLGESYYEKRNTDKYERERYYNYDYNIAVTDDGLNKSMRYKFTYLFEGYERDGGYKDIKYDGFSESDRYDGYSFFIDRKFTPTDILSTRTNNIEVLDFDIINEAVETQFRETADKYVVVISNNDYVLAEMDEKFETLVSDNNIKLYVQGDKDRFKYHPYEKRKVLDLQYDADNKILNIITDVETFAYYMDSGKTLKIGNVFDVKPQKAIESIKAPDQKTAIQDRSKIVSNDISVLGRYYTPSSTIYNWDLRESEYDRIGDVISNYAFIPFQHGRYVFFISGQVDRDSGSNDYDGGILRSTLVTDCKRMIVSNSENYFVYENTAGNIIRAKVEEKELWFEDDEAHAYVYHVTDKMVLPFTYDDIENTYFIGGVSYSWNAPNRAWIYANGVRYSFNQIGNFSTLNYISRDANTITTEDSKRYYLSRDITDYKYFAVTKVYGDGQADNKSKYRVETWSISNSGQLRHDYMWDLNTNSEYIYYKYGYTSGDVIYNINGRMVETDKDYVKCHSPQNSHYLQRYQRINKSEFPVVLNWDKHYEIYVDLNNKVVKSQFPPYPDANSYYNDTFEIDVDEIAASNILKTSPDHFSSLRYTDLLDELVSKYSVPNSSSDVYVLVGEPINTQWLYTDYENDRRGVTEFKATHDPTAFDNHLGFDPNVGTSKRPIDRFNYVGLYKAEGRTSDVTVNSAYSKWSQWSSSQNIYVHRKPVEKMKYAYVRTPSNDYLLTCLDNGSYDPDFSISRIDKGIVRHEYALMEDESGEWIDFDGQIKIKPAIEYKIAHCVYDIYGAKSEYGYYDIKVDPDIFSITGSAIPEYPNPVVPEEDVEILAEVMSTKSIDSVIASVDGIDVPMTFVEPDTDSGGNILSHKYQVVYTIPSDKPDGDYEIDITAFASDGSNVSIDPKLQLRVKTPINLEGDVVEEEVNTGQVIHLMAYTSEHVKPWPENNNPVKASLFSEVSETSRIKIGLERLSSQDQNGRIAWHGQVLMNDNFVNRNNLMEQPYTVIFEAKAENGNEEFDTDVVKFIPNQAPTVTYLSKTPNFIYEGDDVSLTFRLSDPDGDPLDVLFEYTKLTDGESGGQRNWQVLHSKSGVSLTQGPGGGSKDYTVELRHVERAGYSIRVTVTDPLGESGQTQTSISAEELSVSGQVRHVDKWNENRMAYNKSKSGNDNTPRPYDMFWSGEQFNLEAVTTALSDGSITTCDLVSVEILNKSQSTVLNQGINAYTWQGDLWDNVMMDWPDGVITFRFTASFSNGIKKTYDVDVILDNSESYWQIHRLF